MTAARQLARQGLHALAEAYHWVRRGPKRLACAACGRRVRAFDPLPEFYARHMTEAGWPYGLERAETCNVRQYSCPYCQAPDRDRLTALYLDDYFRSLTGPVTVIDFAPSRPLTAYIRRQVAARGLAVRYRTADLLTDGVDDRVDITDMPGYPTGSVDFFLCSHVLEHVTDDRKAMRELRRILHTGGRGVLMVPIVLGIDRIDEDPSLTDVRERWRRFGQDDHVRLYSKSGYVDRLHEAGFVVHELGASHFGHDRFAEQGISPQSVLYVVEKAS